MNSVAKMKYVYLAIGRCFKIITIFTIGSVIYSNEEKYILAFNEEEDKFIMILLTDFIISGQAVLFNLFCLIGIKLIKLKDQLYRMEKNYNFYNQLTADEAGKKLESISKSILVFDKTYNRDKIIVIKVDNVEEITSEYNFFYITFNSKGVRKKFKINDTDIINYIKNEVKSGNLKVLKQLACFFNREYYSRFFGLYRINTNSTPTIIKIIITMNGG